MRFDKSVTNVFEEIHTSYMQSRMLHTVTTAPTAAKVEPCSLRCCIAGQALVAFVQEGHLQNQDRELSLSNPRDEIENSSSWVGISFAQFIFYTA